MVLFLIISGIAFAQTADYEKGVEFFRKGQIEAAIPSLTRAAADQPGNARVWKALGVAYASKAAYEQAEPALRRACELEPKLEDACYFYGRTLYALNRFEPSLEALGRAEAAAARDWKVQLGIAQDLEALGRNADAAARFVRALEWSRGSDPQPGVAYGVFLLRQGDLEKSTVLLRDVAARFPASAEAHTCLGRALFERGENAAAITHLERALKMKPASAQAHLLIAKAYVRAGRTAEAKPHFEAAARYEEVAQSAR